MASITWSIRQAKLDDLPALLQLNARIWQENCLGIISQAQIDYMLEHYYHAEAFAKYWQQGSPWLWLAAQEDQPDQWLGYAAASLEQDGCYRLDKLFVDRQAQGKGLAQALLGTVEAECQPKRLRLQVNRRNAQGLAFYHKQGFSIVQAADFAIGNGFWMEDYIMERG